MLFKHLKSSNQKDPVNVAWYKFLVDEHPKKINLTLGAYKDAQCKPYVFQIVKRIEKQLAQKGANHEYLKIEGHDGFRQGAQKLAFIGTKYDSSTISTVQTVSGCGALSLGFDFLKENLQNFSGIYFSQPTWLSHHFIAKKSGIQNIKNYRYYDQKSKKLDFQGMCEDMNNVQDGSVIVLQVSAHNPTGVDLNLQQWEKIAEILFNKKVVPFFDSAYQGFATGDFAKDGQAVKVFLDRGFNEIIIAQSFAKNMGLYGQRIGALNIKTDNAQTAQIVTEKLRKLILGTYMTPPIYGALIASQILNNQQNFKEWQAQLCKVVSARIKGARKILRQELERINAPGDWSYITQQIGMMSMTGLTQQQCEKLGNKHHVHLPTSGRISFSAVSQFNVEHLAQSIKSVLEQND